MGSGWRVLKISRSTENETNIVFRRKKNAPLKETMNEMFRISGTYKYQGIRKMYRRKKFH